MKGVFAVTKRRLDGKTTSISKRRRLGNDLAASERSCKTDHHP